MATEKRDLIDRGRLLRDPYFQEDRYPESHLLRMAIGEQPTVDAVALPCKIGDIVWAIRCYRGVLVPQQGKVSEMLFTDDMKLSIVVKHICRGEWGDKVFATREDAERAIAERSKLYV